MALATLKGRLGSVPAVVPVMVPVFLSDLDCEGGSLSFGSFLEEAGSVFGAVFLYSGGGALD